MVKLRSAMAGHPYPINTGAYHPSILQDAANKQALALNAHSDNLRRMAMRNSYETRSLGPCTLLSTTAPASNNFLPPIKVSASHLRKKRSSSPAGLQYLDSHPLSSADHLQVFGIKKEKQSLSLKRSSSQSSVAVNKTTPTIQSGSSSYVYHTPSGRKIGSTHRKSHESIKLQVPASSAQLQQGADMKRSSSCSTVVANGVSHNYDDSSSSLSQSPIRRSSDTASTSSSSHHFGSSEWNHAQSTGVVHPQYSSNRNKSYDAWSRGSRTPDRRQSPPSKHTVHPLHLSDHTLHLPPLSMDSSHQKAGLQYTMSLPRHSKGAHYTYPPYNSHMHGCVPPSPAPSTLSHTSTLSRRIHLHPPRGKKVASLV